MRPFAKSVLIAAAAPLGLLAVVGLPPAELQPSVPSAQTIERAAELAQARAQAAYPATGCETK